MDESLLIVTADHSHSLSINGYPNRGQSIFGVAQKSKADGVPYTTLTYATGGARGFQVKSFCTLYTSRCCMAFFCGFVYFLIRLN